jgi:hypothetical protein
VQQGKGEEHQNKEKGKKSECSSLEQEQVGTLRQEKEEGSKARDSGPGAEALPLHYQRATTHKEQVTT